MKKEHKSAKGGLTQKGREYFKKTEGANLKPPVTKKQAEKSPTDANRRKSFCARMSGAKGAMRDENGKPTRKALALKRWEC